MYKLEIQPAILANLEILVNLMQEYYKEDNYYFNPERAANNLTEFINNSYLGKIFVAIVEDKVCGYIIITNGYSFEYGGRDAFIDELFVTLEFRGKHIGRQLLNTAISFCHSNGIKAVHLEVEKSKPTTYLMYLNSGFTEHDRNLMTLAFPS